MTRIIITILAIFSCAKWAVAATDQSSSVHPRIINGAVIDIKKAPYQVALENDDGFFCGGSIISNTFVLTAAHCAIGFQRHYKHCKPLKLDKAIGKIRTGTSYKGKKGKVIPVKEVIIHPKFNKSTVDYDVALLELSFPLVFDNKTKSIDLSDREPKASEMVEITGWGKTDPCGGLSEVLQAIQLQVLDVNTCQAKIEPFHPVLELIQGAKVNITSQMFCVYAEHGGTCNGDSGGPVTQNGLQVGIVSWGVASIMGSDNKLIPCQPPSVLVKLANPEIKSFIYEYINKTGL